jgi:hypothetical protein
MSGFGRGKRSTRRKPTPTPLCPPQIPLARSGREPGLPRWEASDYYYILLFELWVGGGWSPYWIQSALRPLLAYVPELGDCENKEVGGMNGFGRGKRSTRRKPAPTPLCPPQIQLTRPGREPGPPRWEASD